MKNELSAQNPAQTPKLERVSSLLFVGVLLFATLVVPGIALTTQWVMDVPVEQSAPELSAAEQETLNRYHHNTMVHSENGFSGRNCSAGSGLGGDSIFTGLCSETAN